jgi:ubiquinone/menaquinone biosynthesis C-methylase UbiE
MPQSADEKAQMERWSKRYPLGQAKIMLEIERRVCGCDYGGTSWATRQEVEDIAELLELAPGRRLLDIGAGTGWPALYWALRTGCDVVLADVPVAALRVAAQRAAADALSGDCWTVAAEGASLPFPPGSFDSVSHSDVLCCLEAKLSTLDECRRVIRAGGRMVFTVIFPALNLRSTDHELAVEFGPPFVATATDYPTMLCETGWVIMQHRDLTADYGKAVRRLLSEEEAQAEALSELYGEAEFSETLTRRRMTADVIGKGFLRRELFAVVPDPGIRRFCRQR